MNDNNELVGILKAVDRLNDSFDKLNETFVRFVETMSAQPEEIKEDTLDAIPACPDGECVECGSIEISAIEKYRKCRDCAFAWVVE